MVCQSKHFFSFFPFVCTMFRPLPSSWDLSSLNSSLLNDPYHKMFDLYYEKLLENIPKNVLTEVNSHSDIRFVYSVCISFSFLSVYDGIGDIFISFFFFFPSRLCMVLAIHLLKKHSKLLN